MGIYELVDVSPELQELILARATAERLRAVADQALEEIAEQKQVRLDKRERMLAAGIEPYAIGLEVTDTIPAVRPSASERETM